MTKIQDLLTITYIKKKDVSCIRKCIIYIQRNFFVLDLDSFFVQMLSCRPCTNAIHQIVFNYCLLDTVGGNYTCTIAHFSGNFFHAATHPRND